MWPECCSGCFQYIVACVVIVLTSKYAIKRVVHSGKARELREKAKKKKDTEQAYIQEQIDDLSRELHNEMGEVEALLKLSAPALIEEMRSKRLNPILVLKAYVYNACKVTKKLNCVTEVVKDCQQTVEKLPWAKAYELPLFGLPVSLKETFETKGAPSTMGWAKFLDNIPTKNCVIAKVLRKCGAVPFVKTNISHMTLSFECSNPLYGEVSNPHNTDFGAGGSSSGEGALIGAGASVLGIGSDTGGSVRCPSHINGIVGLKPSMGRLSLKGFVPPYHMTVVTTSPGPMARDVDTVVMAMKALCSDLTFQLDPHVVPIKFRDELYDCRKPMRIGYFDDNGFMKPIPACQRAVRMTKSALEAAGHTLIPFQVPNVEYIMDVITKGLFADGGRTCIEILEDDLVDKYLQGSYDAWIMPWWKKKIVAAYTRLKASVKSINMPVGVQCVSSPYNEETCLRLMKEVETLLPMKKD